MKNRKNLISIGLISGLIILGIFLICKNHLFFKLSNVSQNNFYLLIINMFLTLILAITTVTYTVFTGSLVKSEFGPKLYVVDNINETHEWDKILMKDFGEVLITNEMGLLNKSSFKKWEIEVHNNGQGVATDVEISYAVTAYKYEFEFGMNRSEIKSRKSIVHNKSKKILKIDYLPPNGKKIYTVFYMGSFPEADLTISLLKSNEKKFIKEELKLGSYLSDELEYISDSYGYGKLLNIYK